ncbi:MAG: hypothetical protein WD250_10775 [Egibacteraceae bacterium]
MARPGDRRSASGGDSLLCRMWRSRSGPERLDEVEKAQELGIDLIGVHKGVPLGPQPIEHTQTWDMDGAAANFPDLNFVIFRVACPSSTRPAGPARHGRRGDQGPAGPHLMEAPPLRSMSA